MPRAALPLHIPPCIHNPPHHHHPPDANIPLRIHIQGPLQTIQKLLPHTSWEEPTDFPQPGALPLAEIATKALYNTDASTIVILDEYLGWLPDTNAFDYYGVTFDHRVSSTDVDPEVLVLNIIEVDKDEGLYGDGGVYANTYLLFSVDPTEYTGKKVLAVPRCCQKKRGTQDRKIFNQLVAERVQQSAKS